MLWLIARVLSGGMVAIPAAMVIVNYVLRRQENAGNARLHRTWSFPGDSRARRRLRAVVDGQPLGELVR